MSTHKIAVDSITAAFGEKAIPIEDFPDEPAASKELPFTAEDQDIHHAAAIQFISGMMELRKKAEDGSITLAASQEEEKHLRDEYIENIKGMSKPE